MTRTILLAGGSAVAADRFRAIYGIVLEAQEIALATIKSGMSGREADAVARASIDAAGYANEFSHGLGHGVGLEIHERPSLGRSSEDILAPGMVVTVEPGIYVTGWGGVRIEDLVLVQQSGLQRLSWATKELLVI